MNPVWRTNGTGLPFSLESTFKADVLCSPQLRDDAEAMKTWIALWLGTHNFIRTLRDRWLFTKEKEKKKKQRQSDYISPESMLRNSKAGTIATSFTLMMLIWIDLQHVFFKNLFLSRPVALDAVNTWVLFIQVPCSSADVPGKSEDSHLLRSLV